MVAIETVLAYGGQLPIKINYRFYFILGFTIINTFICKMIDAKKNIADHNKMRNHLNEHVETFITYYALHACKLCTSYL